MKEIEEMCKNTEEKLEGEGEILLVLVVRHYNAGYYTRYLYVILHWAAGKLRIFCDVLSICILSSCIISYTTSCSSIAHCTQLGLRYL